MSIQNENKMKFKFLTFLSGLLNIALFVLVAYMCFSILTIFPSLIGDNDLGGAIASIILMPFVILFLGVCVIAAIIYIILGVMCIVMSFSKDKTFRRLRGLMITSIVFDFILAIFSMFLMFSYEGKTFIIALVLIATAIISAILAIVDLCLHKRRERKYQNALAAQNVNTPQTVTVEPSKIENKQQEVVEEKPLFEPIEDISQIEQQNNNEEK